MADSMEVRGGGGFELLAASLRSSGSDLDVFVEVLADKLERALPGRVVVERRGLRRFSRERRVTRIEVALGDNRFTVVVGRGVVEARCAKAVRGVVLKTEALPLEGWLEALGRELAVEAEASEQSRVALDELLRG
ncbi:MAG TPA: hypothetical protein VFA42_04740 [Gaiellaceae bacterium]|nr:hypothetical protein [Gaiellaceae bacterium]